MLAGTDVASLTDADLSFLEQKLHVPHERLQLLRRTVQLSRALVLPPDLLYGLVRTRGLHRLESPSSLNKDELQRALAEAVEQKIVTKPAANLSEISDEIVKRTETIDVRRIRRNPPNSRSEHRHTHFRSHNQGTGSE
jgi:hypothetical protein